MDNYFKAIILKAGFKFVLFLKMAATALMWPEGAFILNTCISRQTSSDTITKILFDLYASYFAFKFILTSGSPADYDS